MKYELSFIISGSLPETEHQAVQREILSYLEKAKVQTDGKFEAIGRKKMAYPINKQKHGFYMFLRFDLPEEKSALKELDTQLKHNNNILRHLIVKLEPAALKPKPQRKPAHERIKKVEPKSADPRPTSLPESGESITKLNLNDLEDLDKRLDEILEREPGA